MRGSCCWLSGILARLFSAPLRIAPMVDFDTGIGFGRRFQLSADDKRRLHPGGEILLIGRELLLDLRLVRIRDRGRCQLRQEIRRGLIELVAVFLVPAQHEILFMTPHHQHLNRELGIVEFLDLAFDVVDRFAQDAFKSLVFAQPQLALGLDRSLEMFAVLAITLARGGNVFD